MRRPRYVSISSPSSEGGGVFPSVGRCCHLKFPLVLLQAKVVGIGEVEYGSSLYNEEFPLVLLQAKVVGTLGKVGLKIPTF